MSPTSAMRSAHAFDTRRAAPASQVAYLPKTATRIIDIAALRADGTLSVSTARVPAIPLFESAVSAFARGAMLASRSGDIAIEDLQPGDWLETTSGQPAQVLWIGSSQFRLSHSTPGRHLTRIMADTFGHNRPENYVTVGPGARLLQTPPHLLGSTGGAPMLTPAAAFVDNVNVIEVVPPTPVQLFHLCLSRHAAIRVGGIEMETFHPGMAATRQVTHAQRDLFLSLFPHIAHVTDFGPLAHPRAPE